MLPRILTVSQNKIVLDETIFAIPEFKALIEYTEGDTLPFMYIWALYDPQSPFMNIEEHEREEAVMKDFPVYEYLQTMEMISAMEKAEKLYFSPLRKILKGAKKAVENISGFLEDTEISDGRDGNLTQIVSTIKSLPQILKAYQEAENAYKQELQRNRGDMKSAIDDDYESNYDD
jgi:hypothetical protein